MKTITLLIFFALTLNIVNAKSNDSLEKVLLTSKGEKRVDILNSLSSKYIYTNIKTSRYYAEQALSLSKDINYLSGYADAELCLGYVLEAEGSPYLALKYYENAKDVFKKINNQERLAESINAIGSAYKAIGDYDKALESYLQSIDIFEKTKDSIGIAYLFNNIGVVYRKLREFEEANKFYEKSYNLMTKLGIKRELSFILNNIGLIHYDLGEYDAAEQKFVQSIKMSQEAKDSVGISSSLNNLGLVYIKLNKFDKALKYFNEALNIKESIGDSAAVASTLNDIGKVYLNQKNISKALEFFNKSLAVAEYKNLKLLKSNNYYNIYESYLQNNDYKTALKYYVLYTEEKSNIWNEDIMKKTEEMKICYKTTEKEKQIESLNNENLRKDLEIVQKNNLVIIFIIVIVLSTIIILIGLKYYKLRSKENLLLKEKNNTIENQNNTLAELLATKDKFFSIIAHDLKNPLSSFKNITEVMSQSYEDLSDEDRKESIKLIHDQSNHLMNLLENLLQWARSQTGRIVYNPENFSLHFVVQNVINTVISMAQKKDITINNSITKNVLLYADPNMTSAVLRNLISNSIKFTQNGGVINISSKENNDKIDISIVDNGVGMSEDVVRNLFRIDVTHSTLGTNSEKGTGLGLIICKEFVEKQGGSISFNSNEGKGSEFIITLQKGQIKD